jgi:hydroxymethylbilane synthase
LAPDRDRLVIGTRGSKLALWQSEYIRGLLEDITGLPVELKIIKTTGDKILDVPLAKVGGKGLFTKEIEVELLAGTVDLAVHSMKDVPTELPKGCVICATPERVDPRDVIVAGPDGWDLATLPQGGTLGGEMGEVVKNSTGRMRPEDREAIAVYLKSLPPLATQVKKKN